MNKQELNETILLAVNERIPIVEMAKLDGNVIIYNEDEDAFKSEVINTEILKSAHFHWNNIHFRFSRQCPKNALQCRKLLMFPNKEGKQVTDRELNQLVKILKSRPTRAKMLKAATVYELAQGTWELLNNRDIDYID